MRKTKQTVAGLAATLIAPLLIGSQSVFAKDVAKQPTTATQADWKLFTSRMMGFAALMPGVPQQQSLGKKPGAAELFAVPQGDTVYLIIVGDYLASGVSKEALAQTPSDRVLDKSRDGYVKGAKGKLVSEKNISVQGYPGQEIVVAHTQGSIAKVQFIYANHCMYQFSVSAPQKGFPNQDTQRFFSSIKLMKR